MAMTGKGLAKLIEECGELVQVAGKRLAYYTTDQHPDGAGSLQERMADEMADVTAAMAFVSQQFGIDTERVKRRAALKLSLFQDWHAETGNNTHAIDALAQQPAAVECPHRTRCDCLASCKYGYASDGATQHQEPTT